MSICELCGKEPATYNNDTTCSSCMNDMMALPPVEKCKHGAIRHPMTCSVCDKHFCECQTLGGGRLETGDYEGLYCPYCASSKIDYDDLSEI